MILGDGVSAWQERANGKKGFISPVFQTSKNVSNMQLINPLVGDSQGAPARRMKTKKNCRENVRPTQSLQS